MKTWNEDDLMHIEICNSHPPLSEKDMVDMFTPFNRLYRTSEAGTGLGLASARKIAEIHEGTVHADYSEGQVCLRGSLPLR